MAKQHGAQIKDDEKYEKLREKGASKEKAARIANAGRSVSKKGGRGSKYEDRSKQELEEKARRVGIEGRSKMDKDGLIQALRDH